METLGWGGKNYIGTKIGPKWKEGYDKYLLLDPSIGISSFIIYKGIEFSELNGMAIIGSLKYENLYALNFLDVKEKPQNILVKEN